MRWFILVLTACVALAEESPLFRQSKFDATAEGWSTWSARSEIAPRTYVDQAVSLGEAGALAIYGNGNAAVSGGWEKRVEGVRPGQWYRFQAAYRAEGIEHEWLQVVARLDWLDARGRRTGQPDYVSRVKREGPWRRLTHEVPAPEGATAVKLQLHLHNAAKATVWWDDVSLAAIAEPGLRKVKIAAVNLRPQRTGSAEGSVTKFVELVSEKVEAADVILLPEGITVVGTGKKYAEVAETAPGPTTTRLAEVARQKKAYIVAGIVERDGHVLYNTAVLLDRAGNLIGKYRKVYLPREEIEGGLTPGNSYPVFRTDFGTIGLMICWDVQYADPARALALNGAELVLVPIWGGNETLVKARAIENQVFIATSGYDYPTHVLDPAGEILARAPSDGSIAIAEVDLNKRYVDKWLGDMRGRLRKELRLDVPIVID
jgi:predicted amidohydrolase